MTASIRIFFKQLEGNSSSLTTRRTEKELCNTFDEDFVVTDHLSLESLQQKHGIGIFDLEEIVRGNFLGEGSFSNVYEVAKIKLKNTHVGDKRFRDARLSWAAALNDKSSSTGGFAIKSLKRKLPVGKSLAIADLETEAQLLGSLDHQNIIKLYGQHSPKKLGSIFSFGRNEGCFIIIEQLQNTLDQKIKSWRQEQKQGKEITATIPTKCRLALQIANALSYLHKKKIIFRDLKPQNIGFKNEQTLKLFDFGLARQLPDDYTENNHDDHNDDGCFLMSAAGSPRYLAPEVFNTSMYNTKVDVYSWSMVFYEMLSLMKPFKKQKFEQFTELVCKCGIRPPINSLELPESIKNLMEKSWEQEVGDRYGISDVCREMEIILSNPWQD